MRNPQQGTTLRGPNAFAAEFLRLDLERNEPSEAGDPQGEGPWVVLPSPSRDWPEWQEVHGLWTVGERPERGDPAAFLSSGRSLGLYASLARPIAGRDPLYALGGDEWRGGYPLSRQNRVEAWMAAFFPEWALITSALASVGQRPYDVAVFLDAIGPACRERAGFFLHERLAGARD
jgi:hypothetical protein